MSDWRNDYKQKKTTAEAALGVLQSRQRVFIHMAAGAPQALIEALCQRVLALHGVEILHCINLGPAPYCAPEFASHCRHNAIFIAANTRAAVQAGRADMIPVFLHEVESLFTNGTLPIDVALIQVSPPDRSGHMSMGAAVDISLSAARAARHVIAQVNPRVPRTLGNSFLTVSDIDAIVEEERPLAELFQGEITPTHIEIARHVAALIPDEATLQIGVGGIPDAVLAQLKDRRDLGVHTEMFSDGLVELIECGAITNAKKTLHPHKAIAAFAMGSRALYEYIDDNPIFEFLPNYYVNSPTVIAANRRMVAVNSAIEIDLGGQVCADSIGSVPFSGIGGQVDFMRGAAHSPEGAAIIALPATAKDGAVSRIVPRLKPGAGVVTSRGDVRWVATEFGAVNLFGRNLRQRAELLITIAHPAFRSELEHAAARLWVK
ncbi:MAG: acetyl-CoA hydrolase/transferase C-terminal domain-containing protein [Bryobacteraceae bacterium]|nr:acetyl-CoA hydrolase/transferase C-terminal domain-containing protein [Bryobacteraceae bacterium]